MNYEIKNYNEAYLEKQYEIGASVLSTWLGAVQSPVQRLRDVYSQDDFDPESKFYALYDNEVIGFLTTKLSDNNKALLEFPIIKAGHEAAEEELMTRALEKLKAKGVTKLISRCSPRWGKTMESAEKYDYTRKELMWRNGRLKVDSYLAHASNVQANDVTEEDYSNIKNLLVSFRQNSDEEAQKQVDLLARISERVTSWKIVKNDDVIVGHDHLVQDIRISSKSRMNAIYATSDEIRNSIMNAHVEAASNSNIQFIDIFFWGPTEDMDGPYLDYGFEIGDLFAYEKEL